MRIMMRLVQRRQQAPAGAARVGMPGHSGAGDQFARMVAGHDSLGGADVIEIAVTEEDLLNRRSSFMSKERRDHRPQRIGESGRAGIDEDDASSRRLDRDALSRADG